jgi:hypothetical protein
MSSRRDCISASPLLSPRQGTERMRAPTAPTAHGRIRLEVPQLRQLRDELHAHGSIWADTCRKEQRTPGRRYP